MEHEEEDEEIPLEFHTFPSLLSQHTSQNLWFEHKISKCCFFHLYTTLLSTKMGGHDEVANALSTTLADNISVPLTNTHIYFHMKETSIRPESYFSTESFRIYLIF